MRIAASERITMKNDEWQLSKILATIVSACRNYEEMQAEILALMNSYSEPWADDICRPVLILIDRIKDEKAQEAHEGKVQIVKTAINTLSYTELEVVVRIFKTLDAESGILIAGKIADALGITRSVVVSALRKLESARIVETRSLGVKGTYIKVLNPLLMQELKKLGL